MSSATAGVGEGFATLALVGEFAQLERSVKEAERKFVDAKVVAEGCRQRAAATRAAAMSVVTKAS
eukprot:4710425-Lingulodinium_polyedra.AAC.1